MHACHSVYYYYYFQNAADQDRIIPASVGANSVMQSPFIPRQSATGEGEAWRASIGGDGWFCASVGGFQLATPWRWDHDVQRKVMELEAVFLRGTSPIHAVAKSLVATVEQACELDFCQQRSRSTLRASRANQHDTQRP
jgi:hypothetical protein